MSFPLTVTTLAATVSDDGEPAGSVLTIAWSQLSGPGVAAFDEPTAATTSVSFDVTGAYVLRLTVADGEATSVDDITVSVLPANQAPVVEAGEDQATSLPAASVSLSGTATDDGFPNATLTTSWSQLSGPGLATFVDASALTTSVSFDAAGAYVLRLTADDTAATASDDVTVFVSDGAAVDLTVTLVDASALVVEPQSLVVTGTLAAQIVNAGPGVASGPFDVTFFEDVNGNGAFDLGIDPVIETGVQAGVDAGETRLVTAELASAYTVTFAGALVYAFVDSGDVVAESDETNNLGSSAPVCDVTPTSGDWNPIVEWSWTGSATLPDSVNVTMTPAVMDMNADGVSDVVFVTYRQNDPQGTNGVLRIVSGVDGSELVTVTDPLLRLSSFGQIAVGDIDLDGFPEILAKDDGAGLLMAFEHDGTHKWTSIADTDESFRQWGGPSIVNLDSDPEPEIVFGRAVFDNTGALMWRGTGGRGTIKGPLSLVADIDQTFPPEIIAGNTIYNADGTIRFQNTALSGGLNAVGNFDADPEPEIVHVANGEIHLLEHDLTVIWGPVVFPVTPITGGIPNRRGLRR